jgi:lactoylglutathione lyase
MRREYPERPNARAQHPIGQRTRTATFAHDKGPGRPHGPRAMIQFLHTRIRVQDLDRSIAFYSNLGFIEKERKDSPQGNKLAFLELPGNSAFLELTWSADYSTRCPEDLMHIALGVPDIIGYCDSLEKAGIEIWPDGWREKFSSDGRKMAFVTDPDGYEVEILER